jgi:predicted amidohydrolase
VKIGVIQLCSSLNYQENLDKIQNFIGQAKNEKVKAIFLPECFYSMSDGKKATPFLVNEDNEHFKNIKNLALKNKIFIIGGSAATLNPEGKIVNRCYNFSPEGEDLGIYDKINLFSCALKKGENTKIINEGDLYTPGKSLKIVEVENLKIGLSICFDLRFPNMFREYVLRGANLLTIGSAFTVPSGRAHWHTLVRARAIENQCFVVAPAQWGRHNEKISTYGHSLIIDPWGEILCDAKEGESLNICELDLSKIQKVRDSIKVF